MSDFTLHFTSPEATLALVGGKGANLGLLTQASFPVPTGFVITTAAYSTFMQANGLQERIVALASDQKEASEVKSEAIRELFAKGKVPADITVAIGRAYAHLVDTAGDVPLAVRSSATAEDLPGASFAGQQDTYLNVHGEAALLNAVKKCWSSLWTARAIDYRKRQGIDPERVSLAVVVQVMVLAEASGIMFTADPISGARDQILLDAAWGLGEAIVGGLVTPDHVIVDKATGEIKQMTIADKTVMTQPTTTGTKEGPVEESRRRAPVLAEAQAAELARLGAQIEKYYRAPQDIEWCFAQGKFYIVQARPITNLPESVEWESPIAAAKWLKDMQAGEWAIEPLSPLGATTTFKAMASARQREFPMQRYPWHALVNGWLYVRADFQTRWKLRLAAIILRYGLTGQLDGHGRVRRLWPPRIAALDTLAKIEPAKLSDDELRVHMDRLLEILGWWWWEVSWFPAMAIHAGLLIKMILPNLADPGSLFRGNDSLLLEAERALREAAVSGDTASYIARFGDFVESADPIHPTLREMPAMLEQHLAATRRSSTTTDERLVSVRRERAKAESTVRSVRGIRGFLARFIVRLGQSCAAHNDDAVFHFQRALALFRYALLEIGQRMADRGSLDEAEDIFYLERAELWQAGSELKELVNERRTLRERQKRLVPPPYIPPLADPSWANDPEYKDFVSAFGETILKRGAVDRDGKKVIVGTSGSPGRGRGIARVITGPGDFHRLQPGEVLVAHATTPVWTPLFNIASAAVTEVGGPFCHAAIVAREFGIPLVDGALDAMREIPDGTPIIVDGSAGVVYLEDYGRNEGRHSGHSAHVIEGVK